jgi:hypothetical protein
MWKFRVEEGSHYNGYSGYVIEADYDGDVIEANMKKIRCLLKINSMSLIKAEYEICDVLKEVQRQSDSNTNLMQMIFNTTSEILELSINKGLQIQNDANPSLYKDGIPQIYISGLLSVKGELLDNVYNFVADRLHKSFIEATTSSDDEDRGEFLGLLNERNAS